MLKSEKIEKIEKEIDAKELFESLPEDIKLSILQNISKDNTDFWKDNGRKETRKIKLPLPLELIKWLMIDLKRSVGNKGSFQEYGVTMFCGRQGAGKTMAMVWQLEQYKEKYPDAIIVTNFGYIKQDKAMAGWDDLVKIRNGQKGVIFGIDEIQNEFDSLEWSKFPKALLRQITQQRKQKVKILCTSQVYSRVVKQLREQCYSVRECRTLAGRLTWWREFEAEEYNAVVDNPVIKNSLHRTGHKMFVQTDELRDMYDSYAVIDNIKTMTFDDRFKVVGS